MKYLPLPLILAILLPLCSLCGCNNSSKNGKEAESNKLRLDSIRGCDSLVDEANNYSIKVSTDITYPAAYGDSATTGKLKNLFFTTVLNISDSLGIDRTVKEFTKSVLDSYRMPIDTEDDVTSTNYGGGMMRYEVINIVKPAYIGKTIVSFCKTSGLKRGGKPAMTTNSYYSFDLSKVKRINVTDIFNDGDIEEIGTLLKEQLLKQEKATDASQLIDLGYFNIDNLSVNNNFYFTNDGIVFNYEPYEIACYAIGEVSIKLSYEDIGQYLKQNNISNN